MNDITHFNTVDGLLVRVILDDDGTIAVPVYCPWHAPGPDGVMLPMSVMALTACQARSLGHFLIHAAEHAEGDAITQLELQFDGSHGAG